MPYGVRMEGLWRAVAWVVVTAALIGLGGAGIRSAVRYFRGDAVTAVVEGCTTASEYRGGRYGGLRYTTICTGSWTLADGRPVRGPIAGVDAGDRGRTVRVRATATGAQVAGIRSLWPLGAFLVIFPVVAGFAVWPFRRRRPADP
jgi:hypothetical protein